MRWKSEVAILKENIPRSSKHHIRSHIPFDLSQPELCGGPSYRLTELFSIRQIGEMLIFKSDTGSNDVVVARYLVSDVGLKSARKRSLGRGMSPGSGQHLLRLLHVSHFLSLFD